MEKKKRQAERKRVRRRRQREGSEATMIKTHRIDEPDTSEIHVIRREFLHDLFVMNRLRSEVFVICKTNILREIVEGEIMMSIVSSVWKRPRSRKKTHFSTDYFPKGRARSDNRPNPKLHENQQVPTNKCSESLS